MQKYHRVIIVCDILCIVFCILAISNLAVKPGLPSIIPSPSTIGTSLAIDGIEVSTEDAVEFVLSAKRIGDKVTVTSGLGKSTGFHFDTILVPYYGWGSIFLDVLIFVFGFSLGLLVYLKRPEEPAALLYHLASLSLVATIVGTKAVHSIQPIWFGSILCILFLIAYNFLPALFVHFTLLFPRKKSANIGRISTWFYITAISLVIWQSATFLSAAYYRSMSWFDEFTKSSLLFYACIMVAFPYGIVNFIQSYRTALDLSEKKKLQWILFGMSVGPAPFILLWVLPNLFLTSSFIPEFIMKIFVLIIPLTFAISILRYHIMDIDLIINRSTVYGIVLGMLILLYLALVNFAAQIVSDWAEKNLIIISSVSAAVIALIFEPVRLRVQQFVDKKFFRVRYNFREAQRRFIEEIKQCLDIKRVADLIVGRIDEIIPVERIGFFTVQERSSRFRLWAHKNYAMLEKHSIRFEVEKLKTRLQLPVALAERVEPSVAFESTNAEVFRRWGMVLVFTMVSESGEFLGFLVLGEKKSGARFTSEDVDLLNAVTVQAGLIIQRITLQQKLLLEQAEAQRLEELNRLKSYFVSSVSHDLKTPLTSIKMFAEVLRGDTKLSRERKREALRIIEGESDRLTRLINNVLDFAKVERGVQEYHFSSLQINKIVNDVLKMMQYQFKMSKCRVRKKLAKKEITLRGDQDAIIEVLTNLLSNALKYSEKKDIIVSTFSHDGFAAIRISDKGLGIAKEDLENIFDPFFRAESHKFNDVSGAGLGLSVVKHIMDAHGGKIEVDSAAGKGSTFTLYFPMENTKHIVELRGKS